MLNPFSLKVSIKLIGGVKPGLKPSNEINFFCHRHEEEICTMEQGIFVSYSSGVISESLVFGLGHSIQFDMNISLPFSRHM